MAFLGAAWISGFYLTSLSRRSLTKYLHRPVAHTISTQTRRVESNTSNVRIKNVSIKPPNILVYTGTKDSNGLKFHMIRDNLQDTLNRDSYVIYKLEDNHIEEQPWSENSELLVIDSHEEMRTPVFQAIYQYLMNGGKVLSLSMTPQLCSAIAGLTLKPHPEHSHVWRIKVGTSGMSSDDSVEMQCEPFYFEVSKHTSIDSVAIDPHSGHPVLVKSCEGLGIAVLSVLHLLPGYLSPQHPPKNQLFISVLKKLGMKCQHQEPPKLTPAFMFTEEKNRTMLMQSLKPKLKDGLCRGQDISLLFCPSSDDSDFNIPPTTADTLPVVISKDGDGCSFDWETYRRHLKTRILGQIVIYTDVVQSTHSIFEGNQSFIHSIPDEAGVIVVAKQQISGKGRGGNAWLSPVGCMMFSLEVKIRFSTELGSRLPFLQHIASLSFVEAVRTIPGYEEINVRLKWPNDIYYGKESKLGGVLVTSSITGNTLHAVVGMGINISNSEPTTCINDIIREYNTSHNTILSPICLEMVLARTVNCMAKLISEFQEHGKGPFLEKYYKRWLHSGSKVSINFGKPESGTIIGLDEFGFLSVEKDSGEVCSVQPDGNTFDMLKNLIQVKG